MDVKPVAMGHGTKRESLGKNYSSKYRISGQFGSS
jgi:hypothetical protein